MIGEEDMETKIKNIMLRKFIATFVTTTVFSLLLSLLYIIQDTNTIYNQGNRFVSWFFIYFVYVGAIILIYGNLVAAGIEFLQRKWFRNQHWLYILILGAFGLVNGVFFQDILLAYCGMAAAIHYGIIDRWMYKNIWKNKRMKLFLVIPIAFLIAIWGFL